LSRNRASWLGDPVAADNANRSAIRSVGVMSRMSPEELTELKRRAGTAGFSIQTYIVRRCSTDPRCRTFHKARAALTILKPGDVRQPARASLDVEMWQGRLKIRTLSALGMRFCNRAGH